MSDTSNLVPEPQSSILASASAALGDEDAARQAVASPQSVNSIAQAAEQRAESVDRAESHEAGRDAQDGGAALLDDSTSVRADAGTATDNSAESQADIPLIAVDSIGQATAADVREALHQVIDPELGIDVVDLGLVYGIEIDSQNRAIITMTLTTPACPLTELIEDQCASVLAGLVEEFRIDWTWQPQWSIDKIRPEGREQLAAIGFNFDNMPKY